MALRMAGWTDRWTSGISTFCLRWRRESSSSANFFLVTGIPIWASPPFLPVVGPSLTVPLEATYESNQGATPQWTSEWRPSYGDTWVVGVEMTVPGTEGLPLPARCGSDPADSWTKWSCAPRGMSESSVGDDLMSASVERTLGEWGGVGGRESLYPTRVMGWSGR